MKISNCQSSINGKSFLNKPTSRELKEPRDCSKEKMLEKQKSTRKPTFTINFNSTKKTVTRRDEKNLMKNVLSGKDDFKDLADSFPNHTRGHFIAEIAGLVKRVLKKINNQNQKMFHSTRLNHMRDHYLYTLLQFLVEMKVMRLSGEEIDLPKFFTDYMFQPNKKINSIYSENQKRIITVLLVRAVEIGEFIDMEYYKRLLNNDEKAKKVDVNDIDIEFFYQKRFTFSFSFEKSELLNQIFEEYVTIKRIYETVKGNEKGLYLRKEVVEFYKNCQDSMERMKEKIYEVRSETDPNIFRCVYNVGVNMVNHCVYQFQQARFIDGIKDIDEVFNDSDVEC